MGANLRLILGVKALRSIVMRKNWDVICINLTMSKFCRI
jgi:hypothetical protein